MEILSKGKFNIPAPIPSVENPVNSSGKVAAKSQPGVNVSISAQGREKYDAELKQTDKQTLRQTENVSAEKKDFGQSLRLDGSILNPSKTEKKDLTPEEKLDLRIEEVKEKIKEIQKEIQILRANYTEQAQEKIKLLDQQVQALLGELNSLMEQKLELSKQGKG